ncbi:hypothetical protein H696_04254 [Fonticula alba]|uniref:Alpha-1,3-glucosyltransferase n=1 Tax=Fonticula alba TaxID=691883 RepID=A0A058Z3X0_FONAL|nr:hypothetical protein H696_04254 [Fonticula alba]KCV68836.1 hypothetical protein H696_04254 [Fonticula alba]|eukprot:XP_009496407.1 hypothetical protein H696_04254 [Fonticula alba]
MTSPLPAERRPGQRHVPAPLAPAPPTPADAGPDWRYIGRALPWAILAVGLAVRFAVGRGGFSGLGDPPKHGDFEAQRHWMEITTNLPPRRWYLNDHAPGGLNDPAYWPLDYPPLSGYLAFALGKLCAAFFDPAWVAAVSSRGTEAPGLVAFMRLSVILCDLVVLFPAAWLLAMRLFPRHPFLRAAVFAAVVFEPTLIIFDHGHFQYNGVMVGFMLAALGLLFDEAGPAGRPAISAKRLLGVVALCAAVTFKQMALFYTLPFAGFMIGASWRQAHGRPGPFAGRFLLLAVAALAGLLAPVLPLVLDSMLATEAKDHLGPAGTALAVLRRVFPVGRGLFEDKVANIWCAVSPAVKLRSMLTLRQAATMAAGTTLLLCLPACLAAARRPTGLRLLQATATGALSFFLASFQVHEKSILIAAMPVAVLMCLLVLAAAAPGPPAAGHPATAADRAIAARALHTFIHFALFSCFPLLRRDGQTFGYAGLQVAWLGLGLLLPSTRPAPGAPRPGTGARPQQGPLARAALALVSHLWLPGLIGMVAVHLADLLVRPPGRLPDLWTMAIMIGSCGWFLLVHALLSVADLSRLAETGLPFRSTRRDLKDD